MKTLERRLELLEQRAQPKGMTRLLIRWPDHEHDAGTIPWMGTSSITLRVVYEEPHEEDQPGHNGSTVF